MHRMWLGVSALFATTVASAAAVDTRDGELGDPYGYTRSVRLAELSRLQTLGKSPGVKGKLGQAGFYRVRGELDRSSQAAQECLEAVASEAADSVKGVEYLCSATLAGNLLLRGDIAGWATQMLQVRTLMERDIRPMLSPKLRDIHLAGISEPHFERFTAWPRNAMAAQAPARDVSVPLQLDNELPTLSLKLRTAAGERELRVHLDSGAAHSRIGRALATELGLTLTEGFMAVDGSPGKLYALAAPVELDIGGVAVRDVSFAVLGRDDLPRIGLDVLRALGRVRVNKDALVIQATASPVPCTRRMATLSSLWADAYDVRYPIRAGKQNVLVKVDTGFNGAFQARGTLPATPPASAIRRKNVITTEGSEDIQFVEATTPVMIGEEVLNLPMDLGLAPGPNPLFNPEWRVGFAATQRYSLYMDVEGTYGCPVAVAAAPPLLPPKPAPTLPAGG